MPQWNLSVRLSGQGSDLARTLRQSAAEARSLSREIERVRREASRDIRLGVTVDAGAALDDLRAQARDAAHSLNVLERAARGAGEQIGNLRTEALTASTSLRRLATSASRASGRVDDLSASTRTFRSDVDDLDGSLGRAGGSLDGLRGRVGGLTNANQSAGRSTRDLLTALIGLSPAVLPLAAGLAPLAVSLSAAGAAGGAFGIAMAGQIVSLSNAADAEQKYQDAVTLHGAASDEAAKASQAYQQQLAAMPPAAREAAAAFSVLKDSYTSWSDSLAGFTMKPVTQSFAVLENLLPRLTPEVKAASAQLDRLVTIAGGAVSTPGFDALADKFARFADSQLDELVDQVVHFVRVLSEGQASGPISEFMEYARANGPAAREAISAIARAVMTLLEGAAQAGPSMLTLVTAAARLVAALPPELVGIILHVAAALKLLQLSGAGMAALAGGIGRVRTQIVALNAASVTAGGGVAGLRAAFVSLGTAAKASIIIAGIAAVVVVAKKLSDLGKEAPPNVDKLTTSLGKLGSTGKTSGEAARVFGKNLKDLYDDVKNITDPSTTDKIQQGLVKVFSVGFSDSTPHTEAKEKLDAIDEALTNLVQGGKADIAGEAFKRLSAAYKKGGGDVDDLKGKLDGYRSAVADQKFEQGLAAQSMGLFGQAAVDTQAKLDAQKKSADGLRQSIQALNDVNRAAGGSMNAFEQSIDDAAKAARKSAGALSMHNGELDLGSQKARDAESALRDLAANTDDAAAKAREQGKSWEYVNGILTRGQTTFEQTAMKMGLTKKQAEALARSYLDIPDSKTTKIEMRTEDAVAGLDAVIAAIKKTPNAKSVTVKTLNKTAIDALHKVGFTTKKLPDGRVVVTAKTGTALSNIGAVQAARDNLHDKSITITTTKRTVLQTIIKGPSDTADALRRQADAARRHSANGNIFDFYADGGMQRGGVRRFADGTENHIAQIAPAGAWRVWAEPETQGEGYVPFARSKRPRSRMITEEIVRRLGGDPSGIDWFADGGGLDFTYSGTGGSANKYTLSGLISASANSKGDFDLAKFTSKLRSANNNLDTWRKDLATVTSKAGQDVADALAEMGDDGISLTHKMATGTSKYIGDMAAQLRNLAASAKASLGEYTSQLKGAVADQAVFQKNLALLAGQGYGDLASRLASQGDQDAADLAAAAVKDRSKAASANTAAKAANAALSADQVTQLVSIISAISSSKTGIHDVAAATGLAESDIIAVGTKAKSQILGSLGSRASKFVSDLVRAQQHLSYADGGMRAGLYATRGGIVRFAEPETHGEAYVPLSPSKRRSAVPVLADVAHRFGLGLTDAQATRPIVIAGGGDTTNVNVTAVRTGATASDIGAQVGRSVRRARRGGVSARAA